MLGFVQIASRFIGVTNVSVALLALSLLLLTGVLTWRDCLQYTPAWDTLIWFGVVIGMSTNLNTLVRTRHCTCSRLACSVPVSIFLSGASARSWRRATVGCEVTGIGMA